MFQPKRGFYARCTGLCTVMKQQKNKQTIGGNALQQNHVFCQNKCVFTKNVIGHHIAKHWLKNILKTSVLHSFLSSIHLDMSQGPEN